MQIADAELTVSRLAAFPYAVDYLIVLGAAALFSGVAALLRPQLRGSIPLDLLLPTMALGTTGVTIGILVGNSLTPIANLALSGVLTAYGGLVVYILGKESVSTSTRAGSAVGLMFIAAGVAYGASIGAAYRSTYEVRMELRNESLAQRSLRYASDLMLWEYSEKKRIDLIADSITAVRKASNVSQ